MFFERLNFQEVREELSYKVITLIYFWLIEYQFIHNNNLLQHLIHYVNINVRLIITSFSFQFDSLTTFDVIGDERHSPIKANVFLGLLL